MELNVIDSKVLKTSAGDDDGPPYQISEKSIFRGPSPFSKQATIHFLHKLPNLAKLAFYDNDSVEILFDDVDVTQEIIGNGGDHEEEIHPTLSAVKTLEISYMDKLLQLGDGNSETVLPNLDTLDVRYCDMLKSLESSAISFRYLTTLKVSFCDRLEYLTSYDVAQSLMQLTTLEVRDCVKLREIVRASNEDGDHDTTYCEIAFSRLQQLTLFRLLRLPRIFLGNCIVKLPSSTELDVRDCPIELTISSQGVLLSNPKSVEEVDGYDDHAEKEKDDHVGMHELPALYASHRVASYQQFQANCSNTRGSS